MARFEPGDDWVGPIPDEGWWVVWCEGCWAPDKAGLVGLKVNYVGNL